MQDYVCDIRMLNWTLCDTSSFWRQEIWFLVILSTSGFCVLHMRDGLPYIHFAHFMLIWSSFLSICPYFKPEFAKIAGESCVCIYFQ